MAVTEASLVTAVRMHLEGSDPRERPYITTLTNAPGTGGTTFSVGDGDAWQVGDLAETPDGELALVTAISTDDLTVSRAYGTVAAENLASGDVLRKNPKFSREQVVNALTQVLQELRDEGIYELATETITYTTDKWYDVTDTAMEKVYSVWYYEQDPAQTYAPFWRFHTDPATGQPKLYLGALWATAGADVYVQYEKPYVAFTGLPDRLTPLMSFGAVYKLYGASVVAATRDPGKRTDRTVQGGQEARDSVWFLREYIRLRDGEVADLARKVRRLPANVRAKRASRFIK